jgi:nickel-dependent lactate racemase
VNRRVLEHDPIIVIGSVEPHYFAGYTGGRKSIFPGLTDLATIERNHNLANSMDVAPMKLAGNPVEEHLQSLMAFIDKSRVISIQLVLDSTSTIARLAIGDIDTSFAEAASEARTLFGHVVEQPLDAIICELRPPLDKNMYQAQKALENCQQAVADGGAAIVVARCPEGIGSEFYAKEAENWDRLNNRPGDGVYRFGSHKISRMVALQRRIDVRLHSALPDEVVEKVFYRPVGNLSAFITSLAESKPGFRLGVVHDSGHTVLGFDHKKPL